MSDSDSEPGTWDDAISEASQHVVERREAEGEAAERQKPKAEGPKIIIALVILAVLGVWNVRGLTSPPQPVPENEERGSLIWFVADAVEAVEDFRVDEGRLPTAAEAFDLFDGDAVYTPTGDTYTITIDGEEARLAYTSTTPLEAWLTQEGAVESGPPES